MDIRQVEQYVVARLGRELPAAFHYHSLRHTQDVVIAVDEFACAEGLGDDERQWIQAAAWFHDLGFVAGCALGHEERSAEIARTQLLHWGWDPEAVRRIEEMILVTRLPCRPQNRLEGMIRDADIEYLGRPEFFPLSEVLRRELAELGWAFGEAEWLAFEIRFLDQVQFYTESCRGLRVAGFQLNRAQVAHQLESINGKRSEI